jgi:recombination protein RecA
VRSKKRKQFEATVVMPIQRRWGLKALRRWGKSEAVVEVPHVPTGFPDLDKALGVGGIPRSRVTEIITIPTAGGTTVALKIIAHTQALGGTAVYIDLERSVDPDYAYHCGVKLRKLVLIRPETQRQGLSIMQDFIIGDGISVLVFDLPAHFLTNLQMAEALSTAMGRLIAPLSRTNCALLFLTSLPTNSRPSLANYPMDLSLPHYAAVRLLIQREHWIYKQADIRGYQAQVLILKNKLAAGNKRASIAIRFNSGLPGGDK